MLALLPFCCVSSPRMPESLTLWVTVTAEDATEETPVPGVRASEDISVGSMTMTFPVKQSAQV